VAAALAVYQPVIAAANPDMAEGFRDVRRQIQGMILGRPDVRMTPRKRRNDGSGIPDTPTRSVRSRRT